MTNTKEKKCCEKCELVTETDIVHCRNSYCPCHHYTTVERSGFELDNGTTGISANTHATENWEEEFDKEFPPEFWNQSAGTHLRLKSFIKELLASERKRIGERVRGLPPYEEVDNGKRLAYEAAITRVLSLLEADNHNE